MALLKFFINYSFQMVLKSIESRKEDVAWKDVRGIVSSVVETITDDYDQVII